MLQVVSIFGALAVLAAFAANQFGWMDASRLSYAVANFVGSGVLAGIAVVEGQLGFILLEGAWALVSLLGIFKGLRNGKGGRRKRGRAPRSRFGRRAEDGGVLDLLR